MPRPSAPAPRGRPRDPQADQAIYEACIQLLSEEGFPSTTVDAVANLSGVSRPSIYRRFANRDDLIESCIEEILSKDVPTVAPTANPIRDVLALLENTSHMLTRTPMGGIFRNALPYLPKYKRVADIFVSVGNRRRDALRKTLERAIKEGFIDEPADIDILIDGLVGAIYLRYLTSQRRLGKPYFKKLLQELTP